MKESMGFLESLQDMLREERKEAMKRDRHIKDLKQEVTESKLQSE